MGRAASPLPHSIASCMALSRHHPPPAFELLQAAQPSGRRSRCQLVPATQRPLAPSAQPRCGRALCSKLTAAGCLCTVPAMQHTNWPHPCISLAAAQDSFR